MVSSKFNVQNSKSTVYGPMSPGDVVLFLESYGADVIEHGGAIELRFGVLVDQSDIDAVKLLKKRAREKAAESPSETIDKDLAELHIQLAEAILMAEAFGGETTKSAMKRSDIMVLRNKIFWLTALAAHVDFLDGGGTPDWESGGEREE